MKEKIHKFHNLLAACLICAIFISALLTAKDYGITWDELPELYLAERNLRYVLTLDPSWLDFSAPVGFAIEGLHPYLPHGLSPERTFFFGNFLSSVGCYLFFEKLNLTDSVSAHHLPNKLLFAGMLAAVFIFVRRNFGASAAFAAIPAITFQPRLWADMQFNLKDFPYACMMAFALISIRNAVLKSSWKGILLSSVLLGLAGATKLNAGLIVLIVAIWIYFARHVRKKTEGKEKTVFRISAGLSPMIAIVVYFLVWPFLWAHPIENFKEFLDFYFNRAFEGPPHFQWRNIYLFASVQPPAVLLFGTIGVAMAVYDAVNGKKRELNVLLLLWLFLPIIRVVLPKFYFFDGVRQIIEYSVPLGIFTGIGFVYFCKWFYALFLRSFPKKIAVGLVFFSAVVLPSGWAYTMYKIHPYEIAYFNFLVGGTKGAQKKWPAATDYWGSSYRDGMKWLNQNAEPGSIIVVPVATHIVYDTRIIWLRNDLTVLSMFIDNFAPESKKILYEFYKNPRSPLFVMYITRRDWYTNLIYLLENRDKPIYTIMVDGAPILKIYKINSMDETMAKTIGLTKY